MAARPTHPITDSASVETIRVTIPFIQETPGVKPYRIIGPLPPEREPERTNVRSVDIENVLVHNARVSQDEFSLDHHGFEFVNFQPQTPLVGDDENTAQRFLDEIGKFLEERFHTPHVFPYDLRIRSTKKNKFDKNTAGKRMIEIAPAPIIHMDLTRKGAMRRLQRHLHQDERDRLIQDGCRILVVNTWMPLENPAIDCPLVVGDRRSVRPSDIIAADQILPDFLGEFGHPRYNKDQVWYWLDKQVPGEMTLFCSFDSDKPGNSSSCPHGTFNSPLAPPDAPNRKSVETRSIIIVTSGALGQK